VVSAAGFLCSPSAGNRDVKPAINLCFEPVLRLQPSVPTHEGSRNTVQLVENDRLDSQPKSNTLYPMQRAAS
jgi:hypothetical protein